MMIETFTQRGFYQFIEEREKINLARYNNLPYPWSDNEILSSEKFCNISREDDRGTIEIRDSLWDNRDFSREEQILLSLIYRFCVSSSTISDLYSICYSGAKGAVERITDKNFKFSWNRSVPYHLPLISKANRTNSNGEIADNLKWIVQKLYDNFDIILSYLKANEGISHEEATTELADISQKFLTKRFKFYFAQGLLDTFYYCKYIDSNLPVHLGIGALKGLKRIDPSISPQGLMKKLYTEMPDSTAQMFDIIDYAVLEHGMCEYTKYCEYALNERTRKFYFLESYA